VLVKPVPHKQYRLSPCNVFLRFLVIFLVISLFCSIIPGCGQVKKAGEPVPERPASENEFAGSAAVAPLPAVEQAAATEPPPPPPVIEFDTAVAMSHVSYLADTVGPRGEATASEELAAQYIQDRLTEYGYRPVQQVLPIAAAGGDSRNVIASLSGGQRPEYKIVVGAHMDTKSKTGPCPGANDNATGCAVVLELARVLAGNRRNVPTVGFVFFGGEEIAPGGGGDDHHFGSRRYVAGLSPEARSSIKGMISVDMVGFGPTFLVRNMKKAPQALVNLLLEHGRARGLSYLADTGSSGLSDHEPFERAGIPSAWIEYRNDENIHGPGDTTAHVDPSKVGNTGQLLQGFLEQYLTPERLALLLQ
jgi:putative aminopeptidase FrvX